jgi:hypothetical protein
MNRISFKKILVILLGFGVLGACEDKFTEMNTNPNGIAPEAANPNLLMTTVLASAAQNYLDLGFNDMAGTMQHTHRRMDGSVGTITTIGVHATGVAGMEFSGTMLYSKKEPKTWAMISFAGCHLR